MKNLIIKSLRFIKNYKKTSVIVAIIILLLGWFSFGRTEKEVYRTKAVERGSVIQEVSVSGRVVSSQFIDLSFEKGGKVSYVALKNGQKVNSGSLIAQLNSGDAQKILRDAELNLENAKIALSRLNLNSQNDIPKLQDAITTAKNNLELAHQNGFNEVSDSFLNFPAIISGIKGVLLDNGKIESGNSNTNGYLNLALGNDKEVMDFLLIKTLGEYNVADKSYEINLEHYNNTTRSASPDILMALISETLETAKKMSQVAKDEQIILDTTIDNLRENNSYALIPAPIVSYQSNVVKYINQLNSHLTSLTNIQNSIISNKQSLVSSQRLLDTEQQGNPLDVASQENKVRQAESAVKDAFDNLAKYSIRAPFGGTVVNVDVKVGQLISPQSPVASLVGDAKFQIETNISEADIAKIKIGNNATVTLDAYGKDYKLKARVVHIDPAGQVMNSVATYKVTLEFDENDPKLLSGLTADAEIQTNKKDDVVYVSSRDIITKDGNKFVRIYVPQKDVSYNLANLAVVASTKDGKVIEVPVETGLRGSDGKTEIVSGLKIGDNVVGKSSVK